MKILKISTRFGVIEIKLHTEKAPATCRFFIEALESSHFDGATVFRILGDPNQIPNHPAPIQVVQFGRMPRSRSDLHVIRHEDTCMTGLRHVRGAVSAARFNPGQVYPSFFICLRDEPALDYAGKRQMDGKGFAVFGEVVRGIEVVDELYQWVEKEEYLSEPLGVQISLSS